MHLCTCQYNVMTHICNLTRFHSPSLSLALPDQIFPFFRNGKKRSGNARLFLSLFHSSYLRLTHKSIDKLINKPNQTTELLTWLSH